MTSLLVGRKTQPTNNQHTPTDVKCIHNKEDKTKQKAYCLLNGMLTHDNVR